MEDRSTHLDPDQLLAELGWLRRLARSLVGSVARPEGAAPAALEAEIVLFRDADVRVQVVDRSGLPVAGVPVSVGGRGLESELLASGLTAVTDGEGQAVLCHVLDTLKFNPDSQGFSVGAVGLNVVAHAPRADPEDSTFGVITGPRSAGETVELALHPLVQATEIVGEVRDARGELLLDATLRGGITVLVVALAFQLSWEPADLLLQEGSTTPPCSLATLSIAGLPAAGGPRLRLDRLIDPGSGLGQKACLWWGLSLRSDCRSFFSSRFCTCPWNVSLPRATSSGCTA